MLHGHKAVGANYHTSSKFRDCECQKLKSSWNMRLWRIV